ESFGYEWNTFDDVREEDAEFARTYFRDLDFGALAGRSGLDAGCGKGRYTRFLAPHLGRLVALDGSSAVQAAARNLASFDNTVVVRADLRRAPFRPGTFGFVSCLGVLHHLEDPRAGLRGLVDLLSPGGILLVYLYSRAEGSGVRQIGLAVAAGLRRYTVRMPHRLLRAFSAAVAAVLSVVLVKPGELGAKLGVRRLAALPMAAYRGKTFRAVWLDTFDRLSAPVEHRYRWEELAPWFAGAGLVVDAVREDAGWFVVSHRPDERAAPA
ncbi:MAG TPA: class I SAM-dependent methyltransferase, partial [Acidimicrobiales bacterium]|nr:class I SAM-dependent methyltransferase [Acidimicrobiales bacterium]